MKKKKYTRKTPCLFNNLRKQPCPLWYFQTQDDLFHAFVDWLDYYDPTGMVRNWGLRREYEPEAADLLLHVQRCQNADEFAVELQRCFSSWFDEQDLKPHFLQRGYSVAAADGWTLWRRFQFNMQKQPGWIAQQDKLSKFKSPTFDDAGRLVFHKLVDADGVDCLFQQRMSAGSTLEFRVEDACHWSDAQVIEKARATGLIAEKSDMQVSRSDPRFVSVEFSIANSPYPDAASARTVSKKKRAH